MIALGFCLLLAPFIFLFGVFIFLFGVRVWLMAQDCGWGATLSVLAFVGLAVGMPILGMYLIISTA